MSTSRVDSKKRVLVPSCKPGEVYDVQRQSEGRLLLYPQGEGDRHAHAPC